ncbi:MAG: hypothetical protein E2598_08195 [Sphingobium sp.]|nr:hypothetical protein [Sphingobium sp.]
MDLIDLDKAQLFLVLAVPGIVILYMRGQFLTGRALPSSDGLMAYITVSLVYYPIALPAFVWLQGLTNLAAATVWILTIFIVPAAVGILLGMNARKGWLQYILRKLGMGTVHPINSAWDWRFVDCKSCWALVILKDGTKWAGFLGTESFMSSDPAERDIYIQQVYEIDKSNNWLPRTSGVWIAHGEIQSIEFWPITNATLADEKET